LRPSSSFDTSGWFGGEEVITAAREDVEPENVESIVLLEATRSYAAHIFAASAALVRAFFASGATGEVPVARREPEGVNSLGGLAKEKDKVGVN
jgi:hypothetical protein